jgi:2-amino-4-hydroxy-6-hydroxymethyldihydropteridine diphosphokinase
MNRAYLGLGSNIDPEANLPAAVAALADYGAVTAVSSVWESAPVGFAEQANFLNAAVLLETELSAEALCLDAIAEIEQRLRRVRDPNNVNAARTIDIDISLFNGDVFTIGHRRIPDPDILTRVFLAIPLAELDGQYVHLEEGRTLAEIAGEFDIESAGMRLRADVVLLDE